MNDATLLLRQIHPKWVQQGNVTSQAFRPTPKDRRKLSVYDGDQISPQNSWIHYTETLSYDSIGVMAVTVAECTAHELKATLEPSTFPEHAFIDFTGFSENQVIKKSKQLKALAESRGWRYQAENTL